MEIMEKSNEEILSLSKKICSNVIQELRVMDFKNEEIIKAISNVSDYLEIIKTREVKK